MHDDCYINQLGVLPSGGFFHEARRVADYTFYENALLLGMPRWEAKLAYRMVSAFGEKAWRRYQKRVNVCFNPSSMDRYLGRSNYLFFSLLYFKFQSFFNG